MSRPPSNRLEPVLVSIVTFNDETFLEACLDSLQRQTIPVRVRVWDNASQDRSREIVRDFGAQLHACDRNLGFCVGHNRNLEPGDFDLALVLNADTVLRPTYLEILSPLFEKLPRCGMAGGKLLRMDPRGRSILRRGAPLIDSTGIYFTPSLRHFDRGNGEEDRGQYDRVQEVFGITGAALLLRREMFEDLGFGRECFDEDFFAYREDADLAWRARLRGWRALYHPRAEALHCRHVLPSGRRRLSPSINRHSIKNRYLMRMKNLDSAVRRRCFPYAYLRDLGILLYVLVLEWSSIPGLRAAWRLRHKFKSKRKRVQGRRLAGPQEIADWFAFQPSARELPDLRLIDPGPGKGGGALKETT